MAIYDVDRLGDAALLFQTGFLTVAGEEEDWDGKRLYRLGYPNRSVRQSVNGLVLGAATGDSVERRGRGRRLRVALAADDREGLRSVLGSLFASVPYELHMSGRQGRYEAHYATVVYAYACGAGLGAMLEESTAAGRTELTVRMGGKAYLFEFKMVDGTAPTGEAMRQLRQKGYADKHREEQGGWSGWSSAARRAKWRGWTSSRRSTRPAADPWTDRPARGVEPRHRRQDRIARLDRRVPSDLGWFFRRRRACAHSSAFRWTFRGLQRVVATVNDADECSVEAASFYSRPLRVDAGAGVADEWPVRQRYACASRPKRGVQNDLAPCQTLIFGPAAAGRFHARRGKRKRLMVDPSQRTLRFPPSGVPCANPHQRLRLRWRSKQR